MTIWTVLDIKDADGTIVATYDMDGTGPDETHWVTSAAYRDGYRRPQYSYHYITEMRNND